MLNRLRCLQIPHGQLQLVCRRYQLPAALTSAFLQGGPQHLYSRMRACRRCGCDAAPVPWRCSRRIATAAPPCIHQSVLTEKSHCLYQNRPLTPSQILPAKTRLTSTMLLEKRKLDESLGSFLQSNSPVMHGAPCISAAPPSHSCPQTSP